MALVCIHERMQRTYFDTAHVVKVIEPVDVDSGRKPCGWNDGFAAEITLCTPGDTPVAILIWRESWPAVKNALFQNAIPINAT